jgi:hypothetical protein
MGKLGNHFTERASRPSIGIWDILRTDDLADKPNFRKGGGGGALIECRAVRAFANQIRLFRGMVGAVRNWR